MGTPPDDPFPDPVRVPVEDSFDLHSFSPRPAGKLVEDLWNVIATRPDEPVWLGP